MLDALGQFVANADEHVVVRRAAIVALSALSLGTVLTGLGAINSKYFNTFVLGRENFVNESVLEWMYWGAKSLTAPLVLFMLALLGWSLLLVHQTDAAWRVGVRAPARRCRRTGWRADCCDDVWMASAWALVTACVVLAAVVVALACPCCR